MKLRDGFHVYLYMSNPTSLFPSLDAIDPAATVRLSAQCWITKQGSLCSVVIGGSPLLQYEEGDRFHSLLAAVMIAESEAASVGAVREAFGFDDSTFWRARKQFRECGVPGLFKKKRGPQPGHTIDSTVAEQVIALRKVGLTLVGICGRLSLSMAKVRGILSRAGVKGPRNQESRLPFACPPEASEKSAVTTTTGDDGQLEQAVEVEEEARQARTTTERFEQQGVTVESRGADIERSAPKTSFDLASETSTSAHSVSAAPTAPSSQDEASGVAAKGLAALGEAEVCFEPRSQVPNVGVLLSIPALASTGLLEAARAAYGQLRHGTYGLRATVVLLFMLALLRKPRPEALKGLDPSWLGDLLGLERAPEVKTLRRKLKEVADHQQAHEFMRSLARSWLTFDEDTLGVLYTDGHVRVYNGKHKLGKAHVTQKRLSFPATVDYWVNDVNGNPVFVVTPPTNTALTQVLPSLLAELEGLADGRKGTIVFDRGGWSPKLFEKLIESGWHILTYRKGKRRKHPRKNFQEHTATIDGKEVTYTLSERNTRLKNGLKLHEIAELRDNGDQTIFVTSHFDQPAVLLAHRMFSRWRQENYFRYMKENFDLDALVDYEVEADDPARDVPNPKWKTLDRQVTAARTELAKLEREYGSAAVDNQESQRPTMRGFKIANGAIGKKIREAREGLQKLKNRRRQVPRRVPIGDVLGNDAVVKLSEERKLFTDAIKAAAYRAETTLLGLLRPFFKRTEDEGRAFLRTAFQQPGDLVVEGDLVRVRLTPMSAPRFTRSLRDLCAALNELQPRYPESPYRLHFEVADAQ